MVRIAYVDHSFHAQTNSTTFLANLLRKKGHIVDHFWDKSWIGGAAIDLEAVLQYDVIIMFQVRCPCDVDFYRLKHPNVVHIPMLDSFEFFKGLRKNHLDYWNVFHGSKILSFSSAIHDIVTTQGIYSLLVRYYPEPAQYKAAFSEGLHGFFWMRDENQVSWPIIQKLLGDSYPFSSFHLHIAPDPVSPQPTLPTAEEEKKYNITVSTWFNNKSDFLKVLDRANVYFAPRCAEGIGQSFLEAMARGQCVVSPNYGTMNEYILHRVNGLLYSGTNPERLDFSMASKCGEAAWHSVCVGHSTWLHQEEQVVDFILTPASKLYEGKYQHSALLNKMELSSNLNIDTNANVPAVQTPIRIAFDMSALRQEIYADVYRIGEEMISRLAAHPDVIAYAFTSNPEFEKDALIYMSEKNLDWPWCDPFSNVFQQEIDAIFFPFFFPSKCQNIDPKILKVFIAHDLMAIQNPHYFSQDLDMLNLVTQIYNNIDNDTLIFSISHNTKNDLLKYRRDLSPEQIVVTPLAAGECFYPCNDEERLLAVRRKYKIPLGAPYILSLATLELRKNMQEIVKAFQLLMEKNPSTELYLVLFGMPGWKMDDLNNLLEPLSEQRDRIVLTGFVDNEDLAALYSGAICFVYMPFYESFGLPPLEAMACGTPVITSNNSSLPEIIGEGGILLDTSDTEGISEAMSRFTSSPQFRKEFSKLALERSRYFNWDKSAEIMINAIRNRVYFPKLPSLKLSIITICYNEKHIEDTCRSITQQTWKKFEWIVVDGGSTDGATLQVLEQYKQHMKVFISEKDNGRYDAMNKGIRCASGEYVLFLNGGDYLADDHILEKIFRFRAIPKIASSGLFFNADILYGEVIAKESGMMPWPMWATGPQQFNLKYFSRHSLPHQATFIRRDLFMKYGGYDASFKSAADLEWFMRVLLLHNVSSSYIPMPVTVYNFDGISSVNIVNPNSVSHVEAHTAYKKYEKLLKIAKNECHKVRFTYIDISHSEKNLHLFLEAFAAMPDNAGTLVNVLCKDEIYTALTECVINHKIKSSVCFWGEASDFTIMKVLEETDVMIFFDAPQERLIKAAIASGIPIIAPDKQELSKYLEDGVTGFSFRDEDISSLSWKMHYFLSKPSRILEIGATGMAKLFAVGSRFHPNQETFSRHAERKERSMAKKNEIEYLNNMARIDNKSYEEINWYHKNKPWCDKDRSRYLMDIAQILSLLPVPPAKLLDLGVGSGWTSKMFAQAGYMVLGADIAPDMITLARDICAGIDNVEFTVADFEDFMLGEFDCVVIYEALHHADYPEKTIRSIYNNLKKGGILITIEPGQGHKEASREIAQRYGTTENDMDPKLQRDLMISAGFHSIRKYIRLCTLPLFNLYLEQKIQEEYFHGMLYNINNLGLSCIVVAEK